MEIRVLGPIELAGDRGRVRLGALMQRRLLAALVIDLGKTCSRDALIDALWGEQPPASARKLIQVYISRLRKALPAPARIVTRGPGYALEVDAESVDATRFERLLGQGREALAADNAGLALSLLDRALELWRGPAFADAGYEDFARLEAERLEELHQGALEEWIAAGLALGRHEALLGQVTTLARAHPLRDRPQGLAMLALHRCGRQAEALEIYAAHRRRLYEELGLEPTLELRDLQRRILQHDPSLATSPRGDEVLVVLPTPPNQLIGRERELTELRELLLRRDVRLLVVTGAGGSGKTRLALEVAHDVVSSFANGAVFVSVAAIRDPALVVGEICRALRIRESPAEEPLQTLTRALHERELLLVVDNVEHLREATSVFVDLVSREPRLTLLVTSRVVLHLSGEHVYPLEPLAENSAAALFVTRAQEADPHFRPGPADDNAVRQICQRLDGLPLAIELGASRARTLTPSELLDRLDPRLPLLIGGPRDLPARQQTLRATLDWTVDLLDEEQAHDLRCLAVFVGGCTLEAAEVVCGTTTDRLSALIDHSLVQRTTAVFGSRYSMLETIREYASDAHARLDDVDGLRRRHAEFFCALAQRTEPELEGPTQTDWLRALEEDHDNLRAALEWCFDSGDPALGAHLVGSLWRFWYLRGHVAEGVRWAERALSANPNARPSLESKLLRAGAILAQQRGDLRETLELTNRRLALAQRQGDSLEIAACLNNLGLVAVGENDLQRAERLLGESVSVYRDAGPSESFRARIDVPLGNLSWVALALQDLVGAETYASESIAIARERGDIEQIIAMTLILSLIRIHQERLSEAIELADEALRLADSLDSKTIFCTLCTPIVILLDRQRKLEVAAQVLGKRLALRDEIGRPRDWFHYRALEHTEKRVREELGEASYVEALAAGARADVRKLLESALRDAGRSNH